MPHATKSKRRSATCSDCTSLREQLAACRDQLTQKNQELAQAHEAFHRLIDRVSHDLRTPLTVVKQFALLMRDGLGGPLTDQQEGFLDTMLLRNDDAAFALNDLLDIGRQDAGVLGVRRQRCRVEDLLVNVKLLLERRARSQNVAFYVECSEGLPAVYCDADQAERCVANLVVNALAFAGTGGEVRLWAQISETSEGNTVTIGITDNGPGVDQSQLDLMLARLDQMPVSLETVSSGSAMGLHIAKQLIHLNLGALHAESTDSGSTFRFTLPVNEPQAILDSFLRSASHTPAEYESWFKKGSGTVVQSTVPATASDPSLNRDCLTGLTVEIVDEGEFRSAPVVDDFLQTAVCSNDLVHQSAPNRWSIMARCRAQDADDLLDRLRVGWDARRKSCPLNLRHDIGDLVSQPALPELKMIVLGTWRLLDQRREIFSTFLSGGGIPSESRDKKITLVDDIAVKAREQQQLLQQNLRDVNRHPTSAPLAGSSTTDRSVHRPAP